jgi:hypothetical protein
MLYHHNTGGTMSITYSTDTSAVVSVWSAHGHRFMSTDDENTEQCITCGAMYQLLADAEDPRTGYYLTSVGDEPAECSGDTAMTHGYPGERHCEHCDQPEGCEHCNHQCPCILCDS